MEGRRTQHERRGLLLCRMAVNSNNINGEGTLPRCSTFREVDGSISGKPTVREVRKTLRTGRQQAIPNLARDTCNCEDFYGHAHRLDECSVGGLEWADSILTPIYTQKREFALL